MSEGVKARRACFIVGISTAAPYRRTAPDKDVALKDRLRSVWRPNMGYRMAHALVKEEFAPLNVKRVHRLWKEEKLGRMKRYRKKRTGRTFAPAANSVFASKGFPFFKSPYGDDAHDMDLIRQGAKAFREDLRTGKVKWPK